MSVSILSNQPIFLLENLSIEDFKKKIPSKSEQTEITEDFKTLNKITEGSKTLNTIISEALSITDCKIIFIDVASEDQKLADKAIKELSSFPSIGITQLDNQTDLTKGFQYLENKLKSCDVVITFYKQAPLNWLKERLRFYQVMQIHRNKPLRIFVLSSIPQPISIKLPKNATWEILKNE